MGRVLPGVVTFLNVGTQSSWPWRYMLNLEGLAHQTYRTVFERVIMKRLPNCAYVLAGNFVDPSESVVP